MCQQERSTLKDEISHQLGKENETFFLRVWKLKENFKKKKSTKKTISARRRFELLPYICMYVCILLVTKFEVWAVAMKLYQV